MKRWVLFLVLVVFATGASLAKQPADQPAGAVGNSSKTSFAGQSQGPSESQAPEQAAPQAPMTPRERAEMRADILVARKEYAQAAKAYEEIVQHEPRNAALLNKIGICYQQIGDLDSARSYYKRAVRADKQLGSAINNLGTLEYTDKRYGKAIKYFKKALTCPGDLSGVYSNLGYSYCGIKEYAQAMEAFSKALALDPEVFERKGGVGSIVQQRSTEDPGALYFVVARSFAKAGDPERTARYLKLARDAGYKNLRSVEKDPDFARVIRDPHVQEVLRYQAPYAPSAEPAAPK